MNKNQTIEIALDKYPKAKRVAVENFTMGYDSLTSEARMNLKMDARLYNWNTQTVSAIEYVLNHKAT